MSEGYLPQCEVRPDVISLKGEDAKAVGAIGPGGGFPCQATLQLYGIASARKLCGTVFL